MRSLVVAIKRSPLLCLWYVISITIPRYILGFGLKLHCQIRVRNEYDTCTTYILYFWLFEHAITDVLFDLSVCISDHVQSY
ncbi:hypothetical protein F4604DRAFT_1029613 [Suillus subluteus]|nr:hypothetical protein F4604DRAFT_1029613 [Suillus subluteus]